jgi:uracil-DNA glycosylase
MDDVFEDVPADWLEFMQCVELDHAIKQIKTKDKITPEPRFIFEFTRLTPLKDVKVVILGQDPYPKAGDAHGLAFSCLSGVPASLKNIYKALFNSKMIDQLPTSGDLTKWAQQGVLLLNCSLTTTIGMSNLHMDIWEPFTNVLIAKLAKLETTPIFMLWGNYAKSKKEYITDENLVLEYTHPSPLAQRTAKFENCDHFKIVNKWLKSHKKLEINWNLTNRTNLVTERFDVTPGTTVVFTDGSCNPNKKCKEAVAGYAACFVLGEFKNTVLYGNIDNKIHYATSQRAEGMAFIKALEYLTEHTEWTNAIFVSDSDFWIKMVTVYMPGWIRKKTSFTEKQNPDLTQKLWLLYSSLIEQDKEITFRHMASHNKTGWADYPKKSYEYFCFSNNDYVDQMATYARTTLKVGEHVIEKVETEE